VEINIAHLFMRSAQNTMGTKEPQGNTWIRAAIGEKAKVILMWMEALGFGNVSHGQTLGIIKIRP
jgi:hypothetical protein